MEGDAQEATVGTRLEDPLRVRVVSLDDEWETDAATLEPGEYTVRYHFAEHLSVNGRPTTLETPEMDVTVGG